MTSIQTPSLTFDELLLQLQTRRIYAIRSTPAKPDPARNTNAVDYWIDYETREGDLGIIIARTRGQQGFCRRMLAQLGGATEIRISK